MATQKQTGTGKAKHPHNARRPESAAVLKALAADDMDALRDALSYRQRRFCEEYIVDYNGAAAVIRAGYAPKWCDRQAYALMMNKGVVRYIDHLTQTAASKIRAIDPDYVIQGIVAVVQKEMARDGDKLRGFELLAKILGMLKDKTEISGPDGGAIEIEQRVKEEAQHFKTLMDRLRERQKLSESDKKKEVIID